MSFPVDAFVAGMALGALLGVVPGMVLGLAIFETFKKGKS